MLRFILLVIVVIASLSSCSRDESVKSGNEDRASNDGKMRSIVADYPANDHKVYAVYVE